MFYRRSGAPEEDELVLCTVSKIQHHSVFVNLDEYDQQALLHISEISPGRIRNIYDYVQEGKKIVCKVLRVDPERGHIDVSLRRVNEGQRRKKMDEIKREQKAEKIVELVANELKQDFKKTYDVITDKLFEKYSYLYVAFDDVIAGTLDLNKVLPANIANELTEVIKQKIKPVETVLTGNLHLNSYASDGIYVVKQALQNSLKIDSGISINYLGNGTYKLNVKSSDPKQADKFLEKASEAAISYVKAHDGEASFKRVSE